MQPPDAGVLFDPCVRMPRAIKDPTASIQEVATNDPRPFAPRKGRSALANRIEAKTTIP